MDTLTLVLLIYFIVIQSVWLTTLICQVITKTDKLVEVMLFVSFVVTVPYIGLFVAIEQFRKKQKQKKETDEENINEETDEENINE